MRLRRPKFGNPAYPAKEAPEGSYWTGYAAAIAILLLAGCADKPPIISADTSCERFRHISATDAQIKVFADNWEVMESYADSVVAHNIEYDKKCLMGPPAP